MERLLVTGVDEPLGCNLALRLADRAEVLGLYSSHAVASPSFQAVPCASGNRREAQRLVESWQPQWIIHCGALARGSWDLAGRENVGKDEPRIAAEWAALAGEAGARLTVVSSDAVFAGPRMFHGEDSPPSSPARYGTQARAMEQALEATPALVVRTNAYGWSPVEAHAGFAQRACEALNRGCPLPADGLRHATPILATDLADLLWRAYELRLQGLYHLAGAERTSPFRFVAELAMALGLPAPEFASRMPMAQTDGWHDETSLNSKKARRALEMATPMLREGLDRFAQQAIDGWRERCHACDSRASATLAA